MADIESDQVESKPIEIPAVPGTAFANHFPDLVEFAPDRDTHLAPKAEISSSYLGEVLTGTIRPESLGYTISYDRIPQANVNHRPGIINLLKTVTHLPFRLGH